MSSKYIIITTINYPTRAVELFSKMPGWKVIVVADKKTPNDWNYENVDFLSCDRQSDINSLVEKHLPWNAYTRKILGYEYAIKMGAQIIYETDDDNIPLSNWIDNPVFQENYDVLEGADFVNIYQHYTEEFVWPRGLPLQLIKSSQLEVSKTSRDVHVGIFQFLADEDPDVDAIYRLTNNNPIYFNKRLPLALGHGTVCPFNSQNTYFRKELFPLLYLPSTVTFRFTDILRGLVAQPILWAAGYNLVFGEATVIQKRNPHSYLSDFESEIPCYLYAEKVTNIAKENVLKEATVSENLFSVYVELAKQEIVTEHELEILKNWLLLFNPT